MYTVFRNHNDKAAFPQDPGLWPSVARATRQANLFRYQYLPYLYRYYLLLFIFLKLYDGTRVNVLVVFLTLRKPNEQA